MKKISVRGTIYAVDNYNIKYAICYIQQIHYEDGTFKYIFKPYYNIIDILDESFFQGIPGLNLALRKKEYIRENQIPTFIYERTPPENRQDKWEILEEAKMDYMDPLKWLVQTNTTYTGDSLIVEKYNEPQTKAIIHNISYGDKFTINHIKDVGYGTYQTIKNLLMIITYGASLQSEGFIINNQNRNNMYNLIHNLYKGEHSKRKAQQRKGIDLALSENKYKGRKKIPVSIPKLAEVIEQMKENRITADEATKILNLKSKRTLYRRINEFKSGKL